jgi:hypothetical protein
VGYDRTIEGSLDASIGTDVVLVAVGIDHLINLIGPEKGDKLRAGMSTTGVDQQTIHPIGCCEIGR